MAITGSRKECVALEHLLHILIYSVFVKVSFLSVLQYNITKEEYLQAYTEYMTNVKNRRLAKRGMTGVKDRRRNAISITKTYHDNGTGMLSFHVNFKANFHHLMTFGNAASECLAVIKLNYCVSRLIVLQSVARIGFCKF